MKLLACETGKQQNTKYTKNINGKIFSYTGEENEGYLIEEVVYSSLTEHSQNPLFKEQIFQTLVETPNNVYLITYNDINNNVGEGTIEYSLTDFSEEEIMEYIKEHIVGENLVFCIIKENELSFAFEKENISFKINEEDIVAEEFIAGKKKVKLFLERNLKIIVLIIMIILTPLLTFNPAKKYFIEDQEMKISQLQIEHKKNEKMKLDLEAEIETGSRNYTKILKEKSLFYDKKKMNELLELQVTPRY